MHCTNQYSGISIKSFQEISFSENILANMFHTMKVGRSLRILFLTKSIYEPFALVPKVSANPDTKKNIALPGTPPVANAGFIS